MPPDPEVQAVTPRSMRPRSTPNAEINAQKGDEWRYQQKVFDRPDVKGASVKNFCKGGKVISSRNM